MKSDKIKVGSKVKIIDLSDSYESWVEEGDLKIGKKLTVRKIKGSGGLLFEECCMGYNIEGKERGLMPWRVKLIK